jgi:tRNA pseudouridine55 synthase
MQPRVIRIDAIDLLDYAWPFVQLRIDCGRGTYVRAIARDLGVALEVGGYLTQLRRTRIGAYNVASAVAPEALTPDAAIVRLLKADPDRPPDLPVRSVRH